jgi:SSS family transporter
MYTAYELMRIRFGTRIRRLTAGTFLLLRALAEGVRVVAIAIVIAIILGSGEVTSILVIVCLTLFYTYEGGMTAVIWTDVIQMFLYVAGAILSLVILMGQIDGGWSHVVQTAGAARLQVFDFSTPDFAGGHWREFFYRPYTFWAGVLGGCFLTTASHGTEQLMVQRLLAAGTKRESRAALMSSWVVIAALFTLFLIVGVCLYTFYSDHGMPIPKSQEELQRVYPRFIWDYLPRGIAGLVMAAILAAAMSNLSAALNSLASTTVMDFWRTFSRASSDEQLWLRRARHATVFWGAVLFAVAMFARNWGNVLQAGLSIASILYGSLLGVFLLGLGTKRVGENAAMIAMSVGLVLMLYIRFGTQIAFTWYVLIGTSATFLTGLAASFFIKETNPRANS